MLSVLIPFWLVRTMTGWRDTLAVWIPLLVIGGTFASVQFFWSNFVGFELVDIVASVSSMAAGVLVSALLETQEGLAVRARGPFGGRVENARSKAPGSQIRSPNPPDCGADRSSLDAFRPADLHGAGLGSTGHQVVGNTRRQGLAGCPALLEAGGSLAAPEGRQGRGRDRDITSRSLEDLEKAQVDVVPLSSTGTAVFLAAILSGTLLGVAPASQARLLAATIRRMIPAILAILCMLALGFVTKYSGMDAVLGLAFTRSGPGLYPIFGTFLGWLGVALTGSDTSSNVLFGNLQKITALKLNLDPILMASANSTGGVMGKMIDAQSIVVAAAATGEGGREGELLRAVLWHSMILALIVGLIVWAYAHLLPGLVVNPAAAIP